MNTIRTSDLPHSLSFIPSYSSGYLGRRVWIFITCQLTICAISSICLTYFLYQVFYSSQKESWKKAVGIMRPISKRLQNLEKERIIWNSYIEWIEDYCSVYYGLLNYINWTVSDLDKLYKDQSKTLRAFSEGSVHTFPSEYCSSKAGDSQVEAGLTSDGSCERTASEEDTQFVANFSRVFSNLKRENERFGGGDEKNILDSLSAISTDGASTVGTNDESGREELEGLSCPEPKRTREKKKSTARRSPSARRAEESVSTTRQRSVSP